jgi:hypothetical protein
MNRRLSAYGTKRTTVAAQHFVSYWGNNGQKSAAALIGLSANDVVDGAYSAASKCDKLVALKAYMNVEGDDGLMRTGWTGDRENPLMGQALLSAG